jgi:hypothetical protein
MHFPRSLSSSRTASPPVTLRNPHVAKSAECVTTVLQQEGQGATWIFEDAYAKHKHWQRFTYKNGKLSAAVERTANWAEKFVQEFAKYQEANLPWRKR